MAGRRETAAGGELSGLRIEAVWPYIAAAMLFAGWWFIFDGTFPKHSTGLLAATGTVSAVLVGFLVTAKAIVLGLTGTSVFKKLVETGYNGVFFRYLYEAEVIGLVLLCVSILGFFVAGKGGAVPVWYSAVWVMAAFLSLCTFIRVMNLLFSFLRSWKP